MSTQSDLDVLLDMGFVKERGELGIKKSGGCASSNPDYHVGNSAKLTHQQYREPLNGWSKHKISH